MVLWRKAKNAFSPDLPLKDVWDEYTQAPAAEAAADHRLIYHCLLKFNATAKEGILSDLLQIEADSFQQNNRLYYIREKIMDLVDRKASASYLNHLIQIPTQKWENDENGSPPGKRLDLALADCEIQIGILRAYTKEKYHDGHPDDWLAQYEYLSNFYHEKMIRRKDEGCAPSFFFDGTSMEATHQNFQSCREKCLNSHVGQKFDVDTRPKNWIQRIVHTIKHKSNWRKLIS